MNGSGYLAAVCPPWRAELRLGVSILSRYATGLEIQIGHLVELPVVGFPLRRQWHLVFARDKRLGPIDEAFLRFVDDDRWKKMIGHPLSTD